jgi:hypothetical protein
MGDAEDRTEAPRQRGDQHDAAVSGPEPQHARRAVGEAPRHLQRRALAPGGTAEHVRRDRPDVHERRHPPRHPGAGLVDLVDDQVVAGRGRVADVVVDRSDDEPGDRQQPQQPRVVDAEVGGVIEREQEPGRRQPGEDADDRTEPDPLQQVDDEVELFASADAQDRAPRLRRARRHRSFESPVRAGHRCSVNAADRRRTLVPSYTA